MTPGEWCRSVVTDAIQGQGVPIDDRYRVTRGYRESCGSNPPAQNGERESTVAWGFGNETL